MFSHFHCGLSWVVDSCGCLQPAEVPRQGEAGRRPVHSDHGDSGDRGDNGDSGDSGEVVFLLSPAYPGCGGEVWARAGLL